MVQSTWNINISISTVFQNYALEYIFHYSGENDHFIIFIKDSVRCVGFF